MNGVSKIEALIYDLVSSGGCSRSDIKACAEKIALLFDDNGATLAAATLENEVTSVLIDMTVATVLATLIEEEGGGRSNVSISPMSMDHMTQHYEYTAVSEGLVRKVSVKLREDSDLKNEAAWREPSNRHGLVDTAPTSSPESEFRPQAEPRKHDRPIWAVRFWSGVTPEGYNYDLRACLDRVEAEEVLRQYLRSDGRPHPVIENRFCTHRQCPTSGCTKKDFTSA